MIKQIYYVFWSKSLDIQRLDVYRLSSDRAARYLYKLAKYTMKLPHLFLCAYFGNDPSRLSVSIGCIDLSISREGGIF